MKKIFSLLLISFIFLEIINAQTLTSTGFTTTSTIGKSQLKKSTIKKCQAKVADKSTTDVFDLNIKVMPNPVSDHARIISTTSQLGKIKAQIFSTDGKIISDNINWDQSENQTTYQLELKELSRGIYFLKVFFASSDNAVQKQIVIKLIKIN